ncbi:MAG: hypothetical protein HZC42_06005 [Candidatus Eisenbacteria bacterium]|nr:hypothetical protein [Candidatus Eisenbacteria bacterium]
MRGAGMDMEQRGITLTEVVIVTVLAALVVSVLLGFYVNSQATWTDGSTQALAQRDATMLVSEITAKAHEAFSAQVFNSPDPSHQGVVFFDQSNAEKSRFWWEESDSLIHEQIGGRPPMPITQAVVTRFVLDTLDRIVQIPVVEMRTAEGKLVQQTSAAALYNR